MSPTGNVRIWWDVDAQAYRMITPFSREFVETFKLFFPASARVWDPESKTWTIQESILPQVTTLVEKVFHTPPVVITRGMAEKASTPPSVANAPINEVIATFVKLCPYEAMQKAYKHAAMVLHPDRGGDMETMSKMNAAWQRLEKELYKK